MSKKTTALILCFFLWWLGVHQFYLGNTRKGVWYLFLLFLVPLWTIVSVCDFAILAFTDSKDFEDRVQDTV